MVNERRTNNAMANRKKDTRTHNNLPNYAHKSKERTTQTPIKIGVNSDALEG